MATTDLITGTQQQQVQPSSGLGRGALVRAASQRTVVPAGLLHAVPADDPERRALCGQQVTYTWPSKIFGQGMERPDEHCQECRTAAR